MKNYTKLKSPKYFFYKNFNQALTSFFKGKNGVSCSKSYLSFETKMDMRINNRPKNDMVQWNF